KIAEIIGQKYKPKCFFSACLQFCSCFCLPCCGSCLIRNRFGLFICFSGVQLLAEAVDFGGDAVITLADDVDEAVVSAEAALHELVIGLPALDTANAEIGEQAIELLGVIARALDAPLKAALLQQNIRKYNSRKIHFQRNA